MSEVVEKAKLGKKASRPLSVLGTEEKNNILEAIAAALSKSKAKIIEANQKDIERGKKNDMSETLLDRLLLTEERIEAMAKSVLEVKELPDPIGEILSESKRPNGLLLRKVRVPVGLIGMIYESRPNVTVDAATLCIKAGSAIILRGGTDAINSNKMLVEVLRDAINKAGFDQEMLQLIETTDRSAVGELLTLNEYLDLVIPRGGAGLIQRVIKETTVPVIETGVGNCHIYVDGSADIKKALPIIINAKTQRPSVCNAAETLLVHKDIAKELLPVVVKELQDLGVTIHGDEQTREIDKKVVKATADDYAKEYLSLDIAVKVVEGVDEAIDHIFQYGSLHTEAIVAEDQKIIDKFLKEVDASTVIANASTRFTDGGEFGFGCEIGISTQKLHARGPMGLPEITSYKYLVVGEGQIRE